MSLRRRHRLGRPLHSVLGGALLCAGAWAHAAGAAPGAAARVRAGAPQAAQAQAERGRDKADEQRCTECHRIAPEPGGAAHVEVPPPVLQGQPAAYLLKQVRDFRSGARRHDFMAIMARSIDDLDAADIAAYYASLPPPGPQGGGPALPALYAGGDAQRDIQACAGCHGAAGEGGPGPRLRGQQPRYLQAQLRAWRNGERRNSQDGAMTRAARALSDAEIDALSAALGAPHPD